MFYLNKVHDENKEALSNYKVRNIPQDHKDEYDGKIKMYQEGIKRAK